MPDPKAAADRARARDLAGLLPAGVIALAAGRSPRWVRCEACRAGVSLLPGLMRDAQIADLAAAGKDDREIAARTGMHRGTVGRRRRRRASRGSPPPRPAGGPNWRRAGSRASTAAGRAWCGRRSSRAAGRAPTKTAGAASGSGTRAVRGAIA